MKINFFNLADCFFVTLFFLLLFQVNMVQASDLKQNCPDVLKAFDNIQIQQSLSADGKRCYFGIHPRDAYVTMIYRDYLLSSDGLLMVFNSYSEQTSAKSDGAREFYFFPNEFTGFQWNIEGTSFVVTGFADRTLKFSLSSAQLEAISGAEVLLADKVDTSNQGGLEILNASFSYVDSGFRFRDSPSFDRSRSSDLKNAFGKSCRVKNRQIFSYTEKSVFLKELGQIRVLAAKTCRGFEL